MNAQETLPESVLFVAYEASQIKLFICIGKSLRLNTSYVPILYCPYALPGAELYRECCYRAGIEYLQGHTPFGGRTDLVSDVTRLAIRYSQPVARIVPVPRKEVAEWVKKAPGYPRFSDFVQKESQLRQVRYRIQEVLRKWSCVPDAKLRRQVLQEFSFWLETYGMELSIARLLIDQLRVTVIVLAEHIAERDSIVWLRVAAERGIAVTVIAQHLADRRGTVGTYSSRIEYSLEHPANQDLTKLFPHWRLAEYGNRLVRVPAPQALAQEWWGIAMTRPWVVNSEPLRSVWVESDFLAESYMLEGVRGSYLSTVGSPHLDQLAQITKPQTYAEKSEVWEQLEIDRRKPLLLCALPANLYPDRRGWECATYRELVDRWLQSLRKVKNLSVLVALHPSAGGELEAQVKNWQIPYIHGASPDVLPHASVYVACISSTISWALACGIPVVNCDAYGLEYGIFQKAHGVWTVRTCYEFEQALSELDVYFTINESKRDSTKFAQLQKAARQHAPYFGRLDGLSMERIIAGICELARRKIPVPAKWGYSQQEMRDCSALLRWLREAAEGDSPATSRYNGVIQTDPTNGRANHLRASVDR